MTLVNCPMVECVLKGTIVQKVPNVQRTNHVETEHITLYLVVKTAHIASYVRVDKCVVVKV